MGGVIWTQLKRIFPPCPSAACKPPRRLRSSSHLRRPARSTDLSAALFHSSSRRRPAASRRLAQSHAFPPPPLSHSPADATVWHKCRCEVRARQPTNNLSRPGEPLQGEERRRCAGRPPPRQLLGCQSSTCQGVKERRRPASQLAAPGGVMKRRRERSPRGCSLIFMTERPRLDFGSINVKCSVVTILNFLDFDTT